MKNMCLSDEYLIDFLEGRLTSNQRGQVEFHLSCCDQCLEYTYTYKSIGSAVFTSNASIAPSALTKRVIKKISRLNKGNLLDRLAGRGKAIILQWKRRLEQHKRLGFASLAPIRGNKTQLADGLVLLQQTFSDIETEISVEKIDHHLANIIVSIGKANPEKVPVRVTLMSEGREVASYLIEKGDAQFESVEFGHYALLFTSNGTLIGRYYFQIKESGHAS